MDRGNTCVHGCEGVPYIVWRGPKRRPRCYGVVQGQTHVYRLGKCDQKWI